MKKKVLKLIAVLLLLTVAVFSMPLGNYAAGTVSDNDTVTDNDPDDGEVINGYKIHFCGYYNKDWESTPEVTGSMDDQTVTIGENDSVTINKNMFEIANYRFTGWKCWPDGGEKLCFSDEQEISIAVFQENFQENTTINFYATWEPDSYDVVYSLDGGTNKGNPGKVTFADTEGISLKNPEKLGYNFLGWYKESTFTNKVTKITYDEVKAFYHEESNEGKKYTLYAKWEQIKYAIAFNSNGGSGSMSKIENITYTQSVKLPAAKFTRRGYTFNGWNTQKDGKGTSYSDLATVSKLTMNSGSTITLYAKWKATTYKITYKNMSGATNNKSNPSKYNILSKKITLKSPKKDGYTFKGWYSNSKLTKKVTTITSGSVGNITLYAKWVENSYSVRFKANGGTGKMTTKKDVLYSKSFKLPANKFTNAGYEFAGWNTKADGSGKSYKDTEKVKKLSTKNKATVTLYAQWKVSTYSVKFVGNGATSGKMSTMTKLKYGKTYQLTANRFKRTGYRFVGWNLSADGSGEGYLDQQRIKNLAKAGATVTLYARWVRENNNNYDARNLFDYFVKQEMTKQGAAGLLGNLYAESGLKSNNLQNTYNKSLGMTDEEYTAAVDSGAYKNFVYDSAGYGLAQWTSAGRKQALLNYARAKEASIGDIDMQLEFLIYELAYNYNGVYETLLKTNSVTTASTKVLKEFEKPKDQGEAVQKKRASYGTKYFTDFCPGEKPEPDGDLPMDDINCPFIVQTSTTLNIRSGPGTGNGIVGSAPVGKYKIVHVSAGAGSAKGWGQLDGGSGWIALDYCKRIE